MPNRAPAADLPIDQGRRVGPADDITKVKGVLLSPTAIEEAVRAIDGLPMNTK